MGFSCSSIPAQSHPGQSPQAEAEAFAARFTVATVAHVGPQLPHQSIAPEMLGGFKFAPVGAATALEDPVPFFNAPTLAIPLDFLPRLDRVGHGQVGP
jgi:hypothetical protein